MCRTCTLHNSLDDNICKVCAAAAPRTQPLRGWVCGKCTFLNSTQRDDCQMCAEPRLGDERIGPDSSSTDDDESRLIGSARKRRRKRLRRVKDASTSGEEEGDTCGDAATGAADSPLVLSDSDDERVTSATEGCNTSVGPTRSSPNPHSNSSASPPSHRRHRCRSASSVGMPRRRRVGHGTAHAYSHPSQTPRASSAIPARRAPHKREAEERGCAGDGEMSAMQNGVLDFGRIQPKRRRPRYASTRCLVDMYSGGGADGAHERDQVCGLVDQSDRINFWRGSIGFHRGQ